MSAVMELTLIGLDCFSFLLEPFLGSVLDRLGLATARRRITFGNNRCCGSWRRSFCECQQVEGKRNQYISLADDIDEFCEWQKAFIRHTKNERIAMTEGAKHMIKAKWDWVLSYTSISDPTDWQLNWLGYDLGLIADWDFPEIAPKFGCPSSELANVPDESGKLEDLSYMEMKAILSSSADRRILLAIRQREDKISKADRRQDHRLKQQQICGKINSFLHVKWMTVGEYHLYTMRSSLVFYYTQHYPDLTNLYLLISSLLEEAYLIESSCVSQSRRVLPSLTRADFDHQESIDLNKNHHPAGPGVGDKPELDRYALILMLVAYLADESVSASGRARSLSQYLAGFLAAYGKPLTEGWRVCVKQSCTIRQWQDGHRHLELIKTQEVNRNSHLVVLDPILSSDNSIALCDAGKPEMSRSANLTENFSQASKMGRLLVRLLDYLEGTEGCQKNASPQRPLCGLFTLCANGSSKQPAPLVSGDRSDQNLNADRIPANQHERLSGNPFMIRNSRRGTTPKMLRNILFLAVFLLMRNLLLNYLERVRSDLKDQAREDLVDLKHALFETEPASSGNPFGHKTDMLDQEESLDTPDEGPANPQAGTGNREETSELLNDLYGMLLMQALSSQAGLDLKELMPLMAGEDGPTSESDEADQRTKITQLLSELEGELGDFRDTLAASRLRIDDEPENGNDLGNAKI